MSFFIKFMANIRIYKQFYKFSNIGSGTTIQNLIDPYYLSASTIITSGTSVIEEIIPTQESLGIYYADLDPNLYSFSNTYDINWYVNYVNGAPIKKLITRFKVNPINIGSDIEIQIINNPIEIEIGFS